MRLIKGHLWEISIHSLKYWKTVLRDKNEPPTIPYYTLIMEMPYEPFDRNGERYKAVGTYLFPFAIRYFKKVR